MYCPAWPVERRSHVVTHPDNPHDTHVYRWRIRYRTLRWSGVLLLILIGLSHALLPPLVWAKCGALDPQACVDSAVYTGYAGVASGLWLVNRTLLLAAYYCYAMRWWVMDVSFRTLTDIFLLIIDPLLVPFALVALLLALLLVLLLPFTGQTNLLSVRGVLIWTILAPVLLAISGPIMIEIDDARMQGAAALFHDVSNRAGTALTMPSNAQTDRMATPSPIYGAHGGSACATSYYTDAEPTTVRSDELAAALFWATATDLHCPQANRSLPDAWYDTSNGPGYAFDGDIGLLDDASERARHLHAIQQGINRLIIGGIPSVLALIDALIQLAFSLALVLLWVGLIVSLPFVFFQQQASPLVSLFRRLIDLFKASWTSSVLLAILFAGMLSLAQGGHALAVAGFSMGGMIAACVLLGTALGAVKTSLSAIGEAVSAGSGITPATMVSGSTGLGPRAAGLALGAATGGAGMALTAAMAAKQTGSGRYAAAAALGRITPVRQLGAVAAAMGMVGEETQRGLWVGSRRGLHVQQRQMQADAARRLSSGLTMRETSQQQRLDRQIGHRSAQIQRPADATPGSTLLQHARRDAATVVQIAQGGAHAGRAGVQGAMQRVGYRGRQRSDDPAWAATHAAVTDAATAPPTDAAPAWAEDDAAWRDADAAPADTSPSPVAAPVRQAGVGVGAVAGTASHLAGAGATGQAVGRVAVVRGVAAGAADDWLAQRAATRRQQRMISLHRQRDQQIAQRDALMQQRHGGAAASGSARSASLQPPAPAPTAADSGQPAAIDGSAHPPSAERQRGRGSHARRRVAQRHTDRQRAQRTAVTPMADPPQPAAQPPTADTADSPTRHEQETAATAMARPRLTPTEAVSRQQGMPNTRSDETASNETPTTRAHTRRRPRRGRRSSR